ncbi:3'-5' RNA nuclease TATDN2-like isoform X2 [Clavelina lepadiformis]
MLSDFREFKNSHRTNKEILPVSNSESTDSEDDYYNSSKRFSSKTPRLSVNEHDYQHHQQKMKSDRKHNQTSITSRDRKHHHYRSRSHKDVMPQSRFELGNKRKHNFARKNEFDDSRHSEISDKFSQSFSTYNHKNKETRRFSEGVYYTKHRVRDSFDTSLRRSTSSTRGTCVFEKELKSPIYKTFDDKRLKSARNVLIYEMNSDIPFIDTHCHVDFLFKRISYYQSFTEYMDEAFFQFPSNFEGMIADWCQPSLYSRARPVLTLNDPNVSVWGAFGCHPHHVETYTEAVEKEVEFHIDTYENVIAWGEMGLDYSDRFGPTDHELQKKVFIRQLKQACRRQYPLVIHCRDADPDLLEIMKRHVPHDYKIHRHCLTTEERDVRPLLNHFPNCYVGFTNLITNKSAYRPRDAVKAIPLDRILMETDTPYFIPRSVTRESQGNAKWSHPGMASCIANELADLKALHVDEVLEKIRGNTRRLYGI